MFTRRHRPRIAVAESLEANTARILTRILDSALDESGRGGDVRLSSERKGTHDKREKEPTKKGCGRAK